MSGHTKVLHLEFIDVFPRLTYEQNRSTYTSVKAGKRNPITFWERNGGTLAAAGSLCLALLVFALIGLPHFRPLRAALGLDWESYNQGFFRDCALPENADAEICRRRTARDRAEEEWTQIRRTNGGNVQFSISD